MDLEINNTRVIIPKDYKVRKDGVKLNRELRASAKRVSFTNVAQWELVPYLKDSLSSLPLSKFSSFSVDSSKTSNKFQVISLPSPSFPSLSFSPFPPLSSLYTPPLNPPSPSHLPFPLSLPSPPCFFISPLLPFSLLPPTIPLLPSLLPFLSSSLFPPTPFFPPSSYFFHFPIPSILLHFHRLSPSDCIPLSQ